tara:strand:- start:116 stop:262 length:147 start_codon:yes stop_codon:yes gene_type:complete
MRSLREHAAKRTGIKKMLEHIVHGEQIELMQVLDEIFDGETVELYVSP